MARKIQLEAVRTYASPKNIEAAIQKHMPNIDNLKDVRYFVTYTQDGRCFPVFIGMKCMDYGIHHHFNVVA